MILKRLTTFALLMTAIAGTGSAIAGEHDARSKGDLQRFVAQHQAFNSREKRQAIAQHGLEVKRYKAMIDKHPKMKVEHERRQKIRQKKLKQAKARQAKRWQTYKENHKEQVAKFKSRHSEGRTDRD